MDYNDDLRTSDAQQQVSVSADLLEQINEQLGEEFVNQKDFIEDAIRYRLSQYQHRTSTNNLHKV